MHLDPEIQPALDALPADFRVAVVLCDLEQLSYEEIAATLGIKVGTVRSRIHRGRVLLREALAHRAPGVRPAEPGTEPVPAGPADRSGRPTMNFPVQHLSDEAVAAFADGVLGGRLGPARRAPPGRLPGVRLRGERPARGRVRPARRDRRRRCRAVCSTGSGRCRDDAADVAAARPVAPDGSAAVPSSWHVRSGAGRHRHDVRSPAGLRLRRSLPRLTLGTRRFGSVGMATVVAVAAVAVADGRTAGVRGRWHVAGWSRAAPRSRSAIGQAATAAIEPAWS